MADIDKCLCCPMKIQCEAEYWYHLISHHKIDGETAHKFAGKRAMIRIMLDCFETLKCMNCSFPFIDVLKNLQISHMDFQQSINTESKNKKSSKRNTANVTQQDDPAVTKNTGIFQGGYQNLELESGNTSRSTCRVRSENGKEARLVSESSKVSLDWSGSGNIKEDSHLEMKEDNLAASNYQDSGIVMKDEIEDTNVEDLTSFYEYVDELAKSKPKNETKLKWNEFLQKTLDTKSKTICEKDGFKFKVEFIGKLMYYNCLECPLKTRGWNTLKVHLVNKHGAVPPPSTLKHLCFQCGQGFMQNCELQFHIRIKHAQEKLQCDYCSFSTLYKNALKKHIKQVRESI